MSLIETTLLVNLCGKFSILLISIDPNNIRWQIHIWNIIDHLQKLHNLSKSNLEMSCFVQTEYLSFIKSHLVTLYATFIMHLQTEK